MKKLTVGTLDKGQRLDKYLGRKLGLAPVSFFYKMLRKKNITLNGKKATGKEILQEGDEISLFLSDETIDKFMVKEDTQKKLLEENAKKIPDIDRKRIIFENRDILLYNKPSGALTQKAKKEDISLNEQLLCYVYANQESSKGFHPSVCNRLDRNTSGMVTFGKTLPGSQYLTEMFRNRSCHKYYLAVVKGKVDGYHRQKAWLKKDEKKNLVQVRLHPFEGAEPIETAYLPVGFNGTNTLLEVWLITGKTHQIRAFLSYMGHPILGDVKYKGDSSEKGKTKGQLLHSWCLQIPQNPDPEWEEVAGKEFYADVPAPFYKAMDPSAIPSKISPLWKEKTGK